jgi:hypothetical protein
MKTSALSNLYQLQHNETWNEAMDRAFNSLPAGERDNSLWAEKIAGLLRKIDFKDPAFLREMASGLQKAEQKARTIKAPGNADQLDLDLCTPDWAAREIIPLPEERTVRVIYATPDHFAIAVSEREENVRNAANALNRTKQLAEIASEPGGLPGGMKRRGVGGW